MLPSVVIVIYYGAKNNLKTPHILIQNRVIGFQQIGVRVAKWITRSTSNREIVGSTPTMDI